VKGPAPVGYGDDLYLGGNDGPYTVEHPFSPVRVVVRYGGRFAIADYDAASDTWNLTGVQATPEEDALIRSRTIATEEATQCTEDKP